MPSKSRLHIAILLCAVFLSRIVLANASIFPASSVPVQAKQLIPAHAHAPATMGRREHVDAAVETVPAYSAFEVCEESEDDDKSPLVLLSTLFSSPVAAVPHSLHLTPFSFSFSAASGHRYLALRVFRI